MKSKIRFHLIILLTTVIWLPVFTSCNLLDAYEAEPLISVDAIPAYSGMPYVELNNNRPFFDAEDYTTESFEEYQELDYLGRCSCAFACIGTDLMPTEKRDSIGQIKPSGWHTTKYDIVEGKYLYNRCHLIGYQLTGENANENNLITGTRYLNTDGMLPFEDMVADYVKETDNHVLYRVTPIFTGENLVADGVIMEGCSVEDNGDGIMFNIFAYNVQPGIIIDYSTGESSLSGNNTQTNSSTINAKDSLESNHMNNTITVSLEICEYVLNTKTKKFHNSECRYASDIKDEYKETYTGSKESLIDMGYVPCKSCNP